MGRYCATNKAIVDALFAKVSSMEFTCLLGQKTRVQHEDKGYTNLIDHLTRSHTDATVNNAFRQVQREGVDACIFIDVSPAAKNLFYWIEWTVMENRELSFCEQTLVRQNTKLDRISTRALKDGMEDLSGSVRDVIKCKLRGQNIGLLFDAWTAGGYHFVAVIAAIATGNHEGEGPSCEKFLLSLEPIDPKHYDASKEMFDADAVIALFDEALDVYDIDSSQLCFLVGDNASINGGIGRKAHLPLIGCANHRLNLAVKKHLELYGDEMDKVEKLMRYLRTSKHRTLLRMVDCPMPVASNATRWSSSYSMLERYKKIAECIDDTNAEIASHLPSPEEKIDLLALLEDLKKFESVNKKLQAADGVTLRDARILFDKLLVDFKKEGTCTTHLSVGAKVVAVPDFENGIVKLQGGHEKSLTAGEKKALRCFLRSPEAPPSRTTRTAQLGYADAALQEKRAAGKAKYVDVDWIPPTSDDVERLFSLAGRVFSDRRRAMLPATLELIVYLRFNRKLWDEVSVAEVLRSRDLSKKRKRQQSLEEALVV